MRRFLKPLLAVAALATGPAWGFAEDPKVEGEGPAALFGKLDANNDGQLSEDEVDDDHKRLFKRLVRNADADKNSQLSQEEFAEGLQEQAKPADAAGQQNPGPQAMFARLDANGDGKIMLDEVPEKQRERVANRIKNADRDGDGALSLAEFAPKAATGQPEKKRPNANQAAGAGGQGGKGFFKKLDVNGDGKVTADEVPEEHRPRFEKQLKKLDANGDGSLTREEFVQGAAAGQQEKKRPKANQDAAAEGRGGEGLLKKLDANGDGKLSREEAPERMKKNFDKLDANADGFIEQGEIKQRVAGGLKQLIGGQVRKRFKAADGDGDGKLSQDEVVAQVKQRFDDVDANDDGFVERQEVTDYLQTTVQSKRDARGNGSTPPAAAEGVGDGNQ